MFGFLIISLFSSLSLLKGGGGDKRGIDLFFVFLPFFSSLPLLKGEGGEETKRRIDLFFLPLGEGG